MSSRHHYLPQFYLKGFTDDDGKFYVFDIKNQRLKSKKLLPKQVFFERNRNTFVIGEEKTDFLESQIYKLIDNTNSKAFQKIVTSTRGNKTTLTDYYFCIILLLISFGEYLELINRLMKFLKMRITKTLIIILQIIKQERLTQSLLKNYYPCLNFGKRIEHIWLLLSLQNGILQLK